MFFLFFFKDCLKSTGVFTYKIGDLSDITSSITAYAILSLLFYVKNPVDLRLS